MNWSFRSIDAFAEFAGQWDELNALGGNSILLTSRFMAPLLNFFARGDELLAIYGDADRPGAMAVMARKGRFSWQTFQPGQAPLGAWLVRPDVPLGPALDKLVTALPGPCLIAAVSQQDPDLNPRPEDAGSIRTINYIETARITLPQSFDDYWRARGKNLRHTMKRQRNRLDREGISTRLEVLTAETDMARAVADYGVLESASWKGRIDSAVHTDNRQGRFYRALLEAHARDDRVAVHRYWYDNKLVASDLCIHDDKVFVILKTTYDSAESKTSPAHLMRQDAFRDLINGQSVGTIEFYGRAMDWHRKWSSELRRMFHVNCYRWPLVAGIHGVLSRPATDAQDRF